jgi:AbrB family looped-hinge helix DNA binding protein
MALVRLLRGGQVTLPADLRQKLKLAQGDYLEAEMVENGVLLKPVSVVERERAWDDLMEIINEPKRREPPTMSPEEEEEWITAEVEAARMEERAKRRR